MKDIILKVLNTGIMMCTFAYIGARCVTVGETAEKFPFMIVVIAIMAMYLNLLVHIILHEAGHLVAGLLTGYRFVSFRIGSIVFIKNKDKGLSCKKMKIQGTAGQCLLCPPDVPVEECPYKLYHAMGGLVNIVTGLIGILLALILPHNLLVFCLCEEFGLIGLALGITNLMPCKSGGIQNDGYNLIDLSKDMVAKKCMNLVLTTNALLTIADSYDDLPKTIVDEIMDIDFTKLDLSNSSIANAFMVQEGLYYVQGNYEKAYELCQYIEQQKDILPIFKNEAKCERMFFELIGDATAEEIEKRYDKKLQQYIKATSIYPSRQRLLYAYYKLCKKDDKKATECMQKLEKMVDTYMIKADAVHELEVAKRL